MSFEKHLNTVKIFLLRVGGATSKIYLDKIARRDATGVSAALESDIKTSFFKPYKSKLDFIERIVTIYFAPYALYLFAVEQFIEFVVLGLKSIVDYAHHKQCDTKTPRDALYEAYMLIFMAIVSPIVNSCDVIVCIFGIVHNKLVSKYGARC